MKEKPSQWKDKEENPYRDITEESQEVGTRESKAMLFGGGGVHFHLLGAKVKSADHVLYG